MRQPEHFYISTFSRIRSISFLLFKSCTYKKLKAQTSSFLRNRSNVLYSPLLRYRAAVLKNNADGTAVSFA